MSTITPAPLGSRDARDVPARSDFASMADYLAALHEHLGTLDPATMTPAQRLAREFGRARTRASLAGAPAPVAPTAPPAWYLARRARAAQVNGAASAALPA